jgi:hypothetical protein
VSTHFGIIRVPPHIAFPNPPGYLPTAGGGLTGV